MSNLNDVTLAVEDTNSLKASNVNVDEEYVDFNTDVDVNTDAVGLSCLSDLNDMTWQLKPIQAVYVEVDVNANFDVNFDVN